MSFNQSEADFKITDEMIRQRTDDLRARFSSDLNTYVIPRLLLDSDVFAAIDVAMGIDKRKIMVEVLRELALKLEGVAITDEFKQRYKEES